MQKIVQHTGLVSIVEGSAREWPISLAGSSLPALEQNFLVTNGTFYQ
jgi:hypothetical protein